MVMIFFYGCNSSSSGAPKTDASGIPDLVKKRYDLIFPNAKDPKWEIKKDRYKITFVQMGNETVAYMLEDGSLDKTETVIDSASLPSMALQYIADSLSGNIMMVNIIIDSYGNTTYQTKVGSTNYLFAENGVLLGIVPEVTE